MSKSSGSADRDSGRTLVPETELEEVLTTPPRRFTTDEIEAWASEEGARRRERELEDTWNRWEVMEFVDPPLVNSDQGQWTGAADLYPPFTPDEFEDGYFNATPIGHGEHGAHQGTINGTSYMMKEVWEHQAAPADEYEIRGEHFAAVINPARFETTTEVAAAEVACELGLGDAVAHVYAFEHENTYYTVAEFLTHATMLNAVIGFDQKEWPLNTHMLSDDQLQRLVALEYLLSDPDRNLGNYLIDPSSGCLYEIDLCRSLRYQGDKMFSGTALDLYNAKVGGYDRAKLPTALLQEAVDHQQAVIAILEHYRLDQAIAGVQLRFQHLRDVIAQVNTPTVRDLNIVEHRPNRMTSEDHRAAMQRWLFGDHST